MRYVHFPRLPLRRDALPDPAEDPTLPTPMPRGCSDMFAEKGRWAGGRFKYRLGTRLHRVSPYRSPNSPSKSVFLLHLRDAALMITSNYYMIALCPVLRDRAVTQKGGPRKKPTVGVGVREDYIPTREVSAVSCNTQLVLQFVWFAAVH